MLLRHGKLSNNQWSLLTHRCIKNRGTSRAIVQNGWMFKGRRGGCPLHVYLEDEEALGIELSGVSSQNVIQVRN